MLGAERAPARSVTSNRLRSSALLGSFFILNSELLVLVGSVFDAWEKIEGIKRSGTATKEELKFLDKFFVIEYSAAGASTAFVIKLSKCKIRLFLTRFAGQINDDSIHISTGTHCIDGISFAESEERVIAHGLISSA